MENEELLATLKEIMAKVTGLDVEDIEDDDAFEEDLDLDSLSMLEVWVAIDRTFKDAEVSIPNEEIPSIKTLNQAAQRLQQEFQKNAS